MTFKIINYKRHKKAKKNEKYIVLLHDNVTIKNSNKTNLLTLNLPIIDITNKNSIKDFINKCKSYFNDIDKFIKYKNKKNQKIFISSFIDKKIALVFLCVYYTLKYDSHYKFFELYKTLIKTFNNSYKVLNYTMAFFYYLNEQEKLNV